MLTAPISGKSVAGCSGRVDDIVTRLVLVPAEDISSAMAGSDVADDSINRKSCVFGPVIAWHSGVEMFTQSVAGVSLVGLVWDPDKPVDWLCVWDVVFVDGDGVWRSQDYLEHSDGFLQ